ncbi:MAG: endonuclease III [Candidatus Latescibacteria bacterium]|nr:endonuclease III [Candidatus Latescibacterota bacterium]
MTRAEKAEFIQQTLDRLYGTPAPSLDSITPYSHLVAVVLSAQCTDVRVNQVTPHLFARAATPAQMALVPVEEIEAIVRPCGLAPRKALAIRDLSQILLDKHQACVPDNFADLEALPGVGHKTASVVMSQVFGHPAFAVDTHIHRLAYRWGLSTGKNVEQTEKDLKRTFPTQHWNKLHLQIIYFGREHCPARSHDPEQCPLCSRIGRRSLFK